MFPYLVTYMQDGLPTETVFWADNTDDAELLAAEQIAEAEVAGGEILSVKKVA